MRLSIVTVNTNEWHVLNTCLRSVLDQTQGVDLEFIVVDNASTDGSRENISLHYPQVKIIANRVNMGFAAANNVGIKAASGEIVLLLNPDTEILDGAIQKILGFIEEHQEAGIVGCKLIFPDGRLQRSVKSFPSLWNVFCESTFLYRLFPRSRLFGQYYLSYFGYDRDAEVDWVCGAFMMIRRRVLETIGLLDEQFYMYTEEVDYCYRAKRSGFEVWFTPRGVVKHFWGGSSAVNRRVLYWTIGSQTLFFKKHFRGLSKYVGVSLLYFGATLRAIVNFVGGCLLLNRKLITKSSYFAFAAFKLLTTKWEYEHNFTGKVLPWARV